MSKNKWKAKAKEKGSDLKIVNMIKIDGEYVNMEELSEEQRMEISRKLLIKLMAGFGYDPVDEEL